MLPKGTHIAPARPRQCQRIRTTALVMTATAVAMAAIWSCFSIVHLAKHKSLEEVLAVAMRRRDVGLTAIPTSLLDSTDTTDPAAAGHGARIPDDTSNAHTSTSTSAPLNKLNGSVLCESPSLPRSSVHIVVGAYKYNEPEAGISAFSTNNYIWDLGLTNADIFWYRRLQPQEPLRDIVQGPCGMQLHERLLLPNFGRDGSAFFDYVLEVYDKPPKLIIFLHGHAAIAWHTTCEAVFARTTYAYRNLVRSFRKDYNHTPTTLSVSNHMMTLTSHPTGTKNFDLSWFGATKKAANNTRRRRLNAANNAEDAVANDAHATTANRTTVEPPLSERPCPKFRERWKDEVFSKIEQSPPAYQSCCASFVLPGERIRRYPRAFYEDLQSVLTDESVFHKPQYSCFEFLVYEIFADQNDGQYTKQDLLSLYKKADGLVNGLTTTKTSADPDETVLNRMEACKALDASARVWL